MKTIFYVCGVFGFLIMASCGEPEEIGPGNIVFFQANDKSINTYEKLVEAINSGASFEQITTIVTQTKSKTVLLNASFPLNMKKLGTTKTLYQLIDPSGGVYYEIEVSADPGLPGIGATLPLSKFELEAGKPLPETITVQIIINNGTVISRGNLRIIKDEK